MAARNFVYSNTTVNTNAQCKVVVYPWVIDPAPSATSDTNLMESTRLDISSQIESVTFSKELGNPAGTFSIMLTNSPNYKSNDWKDILRRGYWLVIYMTQDGDLESAPQVGQAKIIKSESSKIRGICYIERAGIKAATGDKGDVEVGFEITGRDYGVIYEETSAWHNLFQFDAIMLDTIYNNTLNVVGNVSIKTALSTIHDVFYFPSNLEGAKVNDKKSLLSIGLQWLLPKEMLLDIGFDLSGSGKGTYWGSLGSQIKNFTDTGFNIAVEKPTDFLSGNAWEQLKKISVAPFHELFCETTSKGLPQLTFRPIPWGIDKSKYPNLGKNIPLYRNLPVAVTVPSEHVFEYDLAEDDHARYNSFLVTISSSLQNVENNIQYLDGTRFPFFEYSSIKRHGFRPMHVTIDSIINNNQLANGLVNRELAIEANEIIYDYWNESVFAETGTLQKLGSNDVKVGQILKFSDDNPYLYNKRYYIEGYTDTFSIDEKGGGFWMQEIMLTRGYDEDSLKSNTGFSERKTEFEKPGEYTPAGNSSGAN